MYNSSSWECKAGHSSQITNLQIFYLKITSSFHNAVRLCDLLLSCASRGNWIHAHYNRANTGFGQEQYWHVCFTKLKRFVSSHPFRNVKDHLTCIIQRLKNYTIMWLYQILSFINKLWEIIDQISVSFFAESHCTLTLYIPSTNNAMPITAHF